MLQAVDTFIAPICHQQIEILYQDEHILLINKPSGLLSLSGKNPLNKDSVHFRLVQQFPQARLAHRLDFGTSGIMVVALYKEVNANLTKQFQERSVIKEYECIVNGQVEYEEDCIDIPMIKDSANFPFQKVCYQNGKQALSHYRVTERLTKPARTRLLFTPQTGRTHQLRVHCQEIGHPILGCDLYGSPESHAMANRLLLHASSLEFDHPFSTERTRIHSPSPF